MALVPRSLLIWGTSLISSTPLSRCGMSWTSWISWSPGASTRRTARATRCPTWMTRSRRSLATAPLSGAPTVMRARWQSASIARCTLDHVPAPWWRPAVRQNTSDFQAEATPSSVACKGCTLRFGRGSLCWLPSCLVHWSATTMHVRHDSIHELYCTCLSRELVAGRVCCFSKSNARSCSESPRCAPPCHLPLAPLSKQMQAAWCGPVWAATLTVRGAPRAQQNGWRVQNASPVRVKG